MATHFIVLICLIGVIEHAQAQVSYEIGSNERLVFGNTTQLLQVQAFVSYMEADMLNDGNILFSDGHALKTTDGENSEIIAGHPTVSGYANGDGSDARFASITGFVQLSNGSLIVVDTSNNCVRRVDRLNNNMVSDFAGICQSSGHLDGPIGLQTLFGRPYDIKIDRVDPSRLLVTDKTSNTIRVISLGSTNEVSTALKFVDIDPMRMCWTEGERNSMYVTVSGTIQRVTVGDSWSYVTEAGSITEKKVADGHRTTTARFEQLDSIANLREDIYLVADERQPGLRLYNSGTEQVTTLCGPTFQQDMICPSTGSAQSLLMLDDTLYMGYNQGIYKMTVSKVNAEVGSDDAVKEIQTTDSTKTVASNQGDGEKPNIIIWLAVGGTLGAIVIIFLLCLLLWYEKRSDKRSAEKEKEALRAAAIDECN